MRRRGDAETRPLLPLGEGWDEGAALFASRCPRVPFRYACPEPVSAPHAVFLAGLAVWLVSLGRPGWTRRRLDALRRRWRLLAPTCLGLGLIGLADPFARLAPVGVSGALWRFWAAPGLAGRAALLLFVATPLLADVAPAPDGARVIVRRALARLRWTATWVPLP